MSDYQGDYQEQQEEQPGLHESWAKALDDTGIPEMLRGENSPLMQQIRRSEAEANRRIEELSQRQAPEEWQQLIQSAGDDVTPEDLAEAYRSALAVRENPFSFIDQFVAQVSAGVERGEISAPEGWVLKYKAALGQGATPQQAAAAANDDDVFTDPTEKRVRDLEQRLERQQQAELQRRQQQEEEYEAQLEQQEQEELEEDFLITLDESLVAAGLGTEDSIDPQVQAMVGTIATNIIDASDGAVPFDVAIQQAIGQVTSLITGRGGSIQAAAPAAPGRQMPPVGGGSNAMVEQPQKFASKDERRAAMLAAAQPFL
jgi:hypothetical protein